MNPRAVPVLFGAICLGAAVLGSPAFGKGFGGLSLALGVAGGAAACVGLVDPASPILALGVFALIIFHLVLGWKVHSLSRNPYASEQAAPKHKETE